MGKAMQPDMFTHKVEPSRKPRRQLTTDRGRTMLTVDAKTYAAVTRLKPGESIEIEAVNDIVSCLVKDTTSNEHAPWRRINLIKRQIAGGHPTIRIRTTVDKKVYACLVGYVKGKADDCSFRVVIKR